MAIRVTLECGHASMLRVRTTPQGYTHDWEVFVRGVDNADISQYVDKVVFHLHETFPKPKRILKEPPYMVKESGYAGFVIPIDVYLKNKDEPKRIQISYDLILLPTGPAFNNVIRHHEVFVNPPEEFRKKLLKGGGITVSNPEDPTEKGEYKMVPPMVSKPKLSGTDVKKHRMTDLRTSNSFADLFGNPMTLPAKVSPENKRPQADKILSTKTVPEKVEKVEKPAKVKHSPHKEKKKDKSVDDRKDKKDKSLAKEKDRVKEKSKRPSSPGNKEDLPYGAVKKTALLSPPKKQLIPAPPPPVIQKSPSPKAKEKEHKKMYIDKEKDKVKDNFKVPIEDRKFDRKKKKHKEDKSKERKEKDKEHEKMKESSKKSEKKIMKPEKHEKTEKEKNPECKVPKDGRKSPKYPKEKDKVRIERTDRSEATDKAKDSRTDKEKQKHKHKRKDKKDRIDESLDKEKQEKNKVTSDKKGSYSTASPSINPLSTLLAEMPERDSSDSTHSIDDDSVPVTKSYLTTKNDSETMLNPVLSSETSKPLSPRTAVDAKNDGDERNKKEKTKVGRGEERDCRKRKRKMDGGQDENASKRSKDRDNSVSPSVEPVSSSQSPISIDIDSTYNFKENPSLNTEMNSTTETEHVAPDSTNSTLNEPETDGTQVFSEDYVSQLKELQQKIMTLQDNQELQRVVQVIAETGQYEITRKTFDFDLCALDRRTVLRLQQFFSTS